MYFSQNTKPLKFQQSKVTDSFANKSMPLFSVESRHSLPFSENSNMRQCCFIGNSNVDAETANVQSGWKILVGE